MSNFANTQTWDSSRLLRRLRRQIKINETEWGQASRLRCKPPTQAERRAFARRMKMDRIPGNRARTHAVQLVHQKGISNYATGCDVENDRYIIFLNCSQAHTTTNNLVDDHMWANPTHEATHVCLIALNLFWPARRIGQNVFYILLCCFFFLSQHITHIVQFTCCVCHKKNSPRRHSRWTKH